MVIGRLRLRGGGGKTPTKRRPHRVKRITPLVVVFTAGAGDDDGCSRPRSPNPPLRLHLTPSISISMCPCLRLAAGAATEERKKVAAAPVVAASRRCGCIHGVPGELMEEEDSKFVPLNAEDPMYGPPALLLIGFEEGETDKVQEFLRELDGEFLKVIHCTEEMTKQTLWDAMHTDQPSIEAVKISKSMPRICIFSGLTGEEMMMFINAFPETGLEPAAFAALVPNSADKILGEVIEEIMGDHEMLTGKN
uniref:Uncharacterized protein n=1 Tax=Oryza punctata TaxID=4537 RepID=A0A0E0MAC0_ORYPU